MEGPIGRQGLLIGELALGESAGVLKKQSLLADEDDEDACLLVLLRSFFLHVREAGKEAGEETCRGCWEKYEEDELGARADDDGDEDEGAASTKGEKPC